MMAIPDYQTLMLPVLQSFSDGADHRVRDLIPWLADQFKLSPEERKELLPSGQQARFDNRIAWAASYMKQAGLLEASGHGFLTITMRGHEALAEHPAKLSARSLERYPEFLQFKNRTKARNQTAGPASPQEPTLEESLESAWVELREGLAQELLDRVHIASSAFFEHMVVDLLVKMGYGGSQADAAQVVGGSGDGGIDGVIKQDRLGLDAVYVQAKRWGRAVGGPEVQAFAGALDGRQAVKGVMITTSSFTREARNFVDRINKRIILIDGENLARYMIEFGVGVATARTYEVKRVDLDYFEDV
jgi:restriction system protein